MSKKINVLFRWSNYNHYTISALIGLLDDRLNKKHFYIGTLEHIKDLNKYVNSKDKTILGYSFSTVELPRIKKEIQEFKSLYGDKLIIACGGPHATADPNSLLNIGADLVFTGEAEESLPAFLKEFRETKTLPADRIIETLPLNDFDSYPPYAYKRNFFGPVELRRGCLNKCNFCQTPNLFKKVRERSIDYVIDYSKYIKKAGRERVFFTITDALAYQSQKNKVNINALEELLRKLKDMGMSTHLGNFPSEVSPKSLTRSPESAIVFKNYLKNKKIILGGQSGSNDVLKKMKRNHTVEEITESTKILKQNGFSPIVDFLFGIPDETYKERMETIKYINSLAEKYTITASLHYLLPLPGTPYFNSKPALIENEIKEEILKLYRNGIAVGNFFEQMKFATKL